MKVASIGSARSGATAGGRGGAPPGPRPKADVPRKKNGVAPREFRPCLPLPRSRFGSAVYGGARDEPGHRVHSAGSVAMDVTRTFGRSGALVRAKAEVVPAVARVVVVAVGRARVPRVVVERPTPVDPVGAARGSSLSNSLRRRASVLPCRRCPPITSRSRNLTRIRQVRRVAR